MLATATESAADVRHRQDVRRDIEHTDVREAPERNEHAGLGDGQRGQRQRDPDFRTKARRVRDLDARQRGNTHERQGQGRMASSQK